MKKIMDKHDVPILLLLTLVLLAALAPVPTLAKLIGMPLVGMLLMVWEESMWRNR